MKLNIFGLGFVGLCCLAAISAQACECNPVLEIEAELQRSDVVFIGKALSDVQVRNGVGQAEFKVLQIYKGEPGNVLPVFTGGAGSCGILFKKSAQYLVYASLQKTPGTRLWTTICYRTAELERAKTDVDVLTRLQKKPPAGAAQPAAAPDATRR